MLSTTSWSEGGSLWKKRGGARVERARQESMDGSGAPVMPVVTRWERQVGREGIQAMQG